MDKETIQALGLWLAVVLFSCLIMAFSFYIFLLSLPILAITAVVYFVLYLNRKKYRRTGTYSKVIDVDSEVIRTSKK